MNLLRDRMGAVEPGEVVRSLAVAERQDVERPPLGHHERGEVAVLQTDERER